MGSMGLAAAFSDQIVIHARLGRTTEVFVQFEDDEPNHDHHELRKVMQVFLLKWLSSRDDPIWRFAIRPFPSILECRRFRRALLHVNRDQHLCASRQAVPQRCRALRLQNPARRQSLPSPQ